jgi:phosphotransferase system HPr (HPr) family protein
MSAQGFPVFSDQDVMSLQALQHTVRITNPEGFHMRPMVAFVQLASRFASQVKVLRDGRAVDGKSTFDMMQMLSMPDTELTIEVEGPDAKGCLEALLGLFTAAPDDPAPDATLPGNG